MRACGTAGGGGGGGARLRLTRSSTRAPPPAAAPTNVRSRLQWGCLKVYSYKHETMATRYLLLLAFMMASICWRMALEAESSSSSSSSSLSS